jgi:hypothetical protein
MHAHVRVCVYVPSTDALMYYSLRSSCHKHIRYRELGRVTRAGVSWQNKNKTKQKKKRKKEEKKQTNGYYWIHANLQL